MRGGTAQSPEARLIFPPMEGFFGARNSVLLQRFVEIPVEKDRHYYE
jgi:hypothetical protein